MTSRIRVLIADDHPIVREGLCRVLDGQDDLECIAVATDGNEATKLATELRPDVAVLDMIMPGTDGIGVAQQIRANSPETAVLILSAFTFSQDIPSCIAAGVRGYLLKGTAGGELCDAIRMVYSGKLVFDFPSIDCRPKELSNSYNQDDSTRSKILNDREIAVLKLASKGMGNKEIASKLCISHHTVGSHLVNIFRKLDVESRTEAVLRAIKNGFLSIDDI